MLLILSMLYDFDMHQLYSTKGKQLLFVFYQIYLFCFNFIGVWNRSETWNQGIELILSIAVYGWCALKKIIWGEKLFSQVLNFTDNMKVLLLEDSVFLHSLDTCHFMFIIATFNKYTSNFNSLYIWIHYVLIVIKI